MATVIVNTIDRSVGQDPTYGINNYNLPKILSETESYARNVLTLLFGKPGFYPSIPTLGMDIGQYLYKFIDEINVSEIKNKLISQCEDFVPEVETGALDVELKVLQDRPVLIFTLPVIRDDNAVAVVLGVTINNKGELVYQYTDNQIHQFI